MESTIRSSFTEATSLVLNEIGFSEFAVNEEASSDERASIVAAVGMVGDLRGHFVVRIGADSALSFVTLVSGHLGMLGENPSDQQYRKAVIGEIANQISGRATAILSNKGVECMITPPTVIAGEGVETALPESDDRIAFTVSGGFGSIRCSVALKRSKSI